MSNTQTFDNGFALRFAQLSAIGGRTENQDALANAYQDDLACFVISDGAGGYEGGEIASKIVVEAVIRQFNEEAAFGPRALLSYIDGANTQVAQRKSEEHRLRTMCATVATLLIDGRNRLALWGHVGDTRIYLFRSNKLHRVTKDHTLVQQMVNAGIYGAEKLRTHPHRNILSLAIDGEKGKVAEVIDVAAAIQADDRYLLCTDGFWEWIAEEEMAYVAASTRTAGEWLDAMRAIVEINASASVTPPDNYTAFAVCFEDRTLAARIV